MLLRAKEKKEKGILLALSSLPSPHGIGSLGEQAYRFVEMLKKTGQSYWQMLPLCPLGKGNSPYSSPASFADEMLYIDIDMLISDGLLTAEEVGNPIFPKNVDYEEVRRVKIPLLRLAASRFNTSKGEFKSFVAKNKYWLEDYSLFMAIKDANLNAGFLKWEDGLKYRLPEALTEFKRTHLKEIRFFEITQYFFFSQYSRLHSFANQNGIKIIGDLPFYLALESADVWANSELFKLGRDMTPTAVAGVPPDIFSATGQLWGNPIYNIEYLKATNFAWFKQRIFHNTCLYDVIRIDHFRAFADYYSIPANARDARSGRWEKGMGMTFWSSVLPRLKKGQIIAEDLGGEDSPLVQRLLEDTGFPNMKVLQFAFDSDLSDPYLPKNFTSNCVCYTGTHDNNTTLGWYNNADDREKLMFSKAVPQKYNSPVLNLIAFALKSRAKITIIPFQDYLELGQSARLNVPGTEKGNWEWRFKQSDITPTLIKTISKV